MKIHFLFSLLFIFLFSISCQRISHWFSSSKTENIEQTKTTSIDSFAYTIDGQAYTLLGKHCKNADLEAIKELIKQGADIKLASKDGIYQYDALYVAIKNQHLSLVKYLIEQGANVNQIYTKDGITPLVLACSIDNENIVTELLQKGANPNGAELDKNNYSLLPLSSAIQNENFIIAQKLINAGANIDFHNDKNTTFRNLFLSKGPQWSKLIPNNQYNINENWYGDYLLEAINKNQHRVKYFISIKSSGTTLTISENKMSKTYKNVITRPINEDELELIFAPEMKDNMGIIHLTQFVDKYFISGNSIYFINPSVEELVIKKLN